MACNCPVGMKYHAGNCPEWPNELRSGVRELSREQESAIARLAIDHASVAVAPQEDGTVKVEAGGRTQILDQDGNAAPVPVERAYVDLPIDLLRRMLGDDVIDAAVKDVADASYPDHALATKIGEDVCVRILELLATSRAASAMLVGREEA